MTLSYAPVFAQFGEKYNDDTANECYGDLCYTDGYPYCVCGGFSTVETIELNRNRLVSQWETQCGGDDDDEEGYRGSGRITAQFNPGCGGGDCGNCAECIVKYG